MGIAFENAADSSTYIQYTLLHYNINCNLLYNTHSLGLYEKKHGFTSEKKLDI